MRGVPAQLKTAQVRDSTHLADLANYRPGPAARLLDGTLSIERTCLRTIDLPFGLSVIASAIST